jgi:hypothetical protein
MRWFVAALALTVIGAIFGSVDALVLGRPALTVTGQVVSLDDKGDVKETGPARPQ